MEADGLNYWKCLMIYAAFESFETVDHTLPSLSCRLQWSGARQDP